MTPPAVDTAHVRPARPADIDSLYLMASITGGGMTNLPLDRGALEQKLRWSDASMRAAIDAPHDEFYLLVLDDGTGKVIGTASIYSRLGRRWPFYSYKASRVTHVSRELNRVFSTHVLHLVNDFDGASEVGGLLLDPGHRRGGFGSLLARSRYLFIALHRPRFGKRVIADLRGWAENGRSPFWEAVAGPFFGSDFQDADLHNAVHGNQFIADLMPRHPIYVSMLPPAARDAIGRPHADSVPALRMLEAEGFRHEGYCDIFDAGPTVWADTEEIRTIRQARTSCIDGRLIIEAPGSPPIAASGELSDFKALIAAREV